MDLFILEYVLFKAQKFNYNSLIFNKYGFIVIHLY